MKRISAGLLAAALLLAISACSSTTTTNEGGANANRPANANANANSNGNAGPNANASPGNTANAQPSPAANRFDVVFSLRGERQPTDAQVAAQKRDYLNVIIANTLKPGEYDTGDMNAKFKDPAATSLSGEDRVIVITLASPQGKKLAKGTYNGLAEGQAIDSAPAGQPFAIINAYTPSGKKQLAGTVEVGSVDKNMVSFSLKGLPPELKLTAMGYGAPYKN
ncbi:MAG TPA: hypothetical protein VN256_15425 [Pyrinomonadaceae bacterium]|nr:hypothetical protein [Pyrinomonadaceae bacterium]